MTKNRILLKLFWIRFRCNLCHLIGFSIDWATNWLSFCWDPNDCPLLSNSAIKGSINFSKLLNMEDNDDQFKFLAFGFQLEIFYLFKVKHITVKCISIMRQQQQAHINNSKWFTQWNKADRQIQCYRPFCMPSTTSMRLVRVEYHTSLCLMNVWRAHSRMCLACIKQTISNLTLKIEHFVLNNKWFREHCSRECSGA